MNQNVVTVCFFIFSVLHIYSLERSSLCLRSHNSTFRPVAVFLGPHLHATHLFLWCPVYIAHVPFHLVIEPPRSFCFGLNARRFAFGALPAMFVFCLRSARWSSCGGEFATPNGPRGRFWRMTWASARPCRSSRFSLPYSRKQVQSAVYMGAASETTACLGQIIGFHVMNSIFQGR